MIELDAVECIAVLQALRQYKQFTPTEHDIVIKIKNSDYYHYPNVMALVQDLETKMRHSPIGGR